MNLPRVSDPELELQIIAAPDTVAVEATIEFRVTAYGFKQRATHRYITVTDREINEEQIDGPLRAWSHRQTFDAVSDSECRLTDEIRFEPPGGMLGFMLTEARIREAIAAGMSARYDALRQLIQEGELR